MYANTNDPMYNTTVPYNLYSPSFFLELIIAFSPLLVSFLYYLQLAAPTPESALKTLSKSLAVFSVYSNA